MQSRSESRLEDGKEKRKKKTRNLKIVGIINSALKQKEM